MGLLYGYITPFWLSRAKPEVCSLPLSFIQKRTFAFPITTTVTCPADIGPGLCFPGNQTSFPDWVVGVWLPLHFVHRLHDCIVNKFSFSLCPRNSLVTPYFSSEMDICFRTFSTGFLNKSSRRIKTSLISFPNPLTNWCNISSSFLLLQKNNAHSCWACVFFWSALKSVGKGSTIMILWHFSVYLNMVMPEIRWG